MKRKIINTKFHGIIDYAFGLTLLLPWITNYKQAAPDTLLLGGIGATALFMNLCTDYEFGLIKLLPMKVHLILDICINILLIVSPWLFSIYNYLLYWPLLMGAMGMLVVFLSSDEPYRLTRSDRNITTP